MNKFAEDIERGFFQEQQRIQTGLLYLTKQQVDDLIQKLAESSFNICLETTVERRKKGQNQQPLAINATKLYANWFITGQRPKIF